MERKIRYLYWWKSRPNVGDAASKPIVEWMLGYKVNFAASTSWWQEIKRVIRKSIQDKRIPRWETPLSPNEKVLYAVGSIIDNIGSKAIIWGSGLGRTYSRIKGNPIIWAVRGYLTLQNLPDTYDKSKIAIGDPAVLLPLVYPKEKIPPVNLVGVIPHFEDYEYINEKYGNKKYKIIDIRTTDVSSFIDEVISCKYILSTAMHGIIISHAYGVPALWIRRLEMNVGDFKFSDYFSSVSLPNYDGFTNIDEILTKLDIPAFFKENSDKALVDPQVLKTVQANLLKSFRKKY